MSHKISSNSSLSLPLPLSSSSSPSLSSSQLKHSIFRDPLGNHGDYSRGICYEGRMKYLYSPSSPTSSSSSSSNSCNSFFNSNFNTEQSLEPPKEMMNNRQVTLSSYHFSSLPFRSFTFLFLLSLTLNIFLSFFSFTFLET